MFQLCFILLNEAHFAQIPPLEGYKLCELDISRSKTLITFTNEQHFIQIN